MHLLLSSQEINHRKWPHKPKCLLIAHVIVISHHGYVGRWVCPCPDHSHSPLSTIVFFLCSSSAMSSKQSAQSMSCGQPMHSHQTFSSLGAPEGAEGVHSKIVEAGRQSKNINIRSCFLRVHSHRMISITVAHAKTFTSNPEVHGREYIAPVGDPQWTTRRCS